MSQADLFDTRHSLSTRKPSIPGKHSATASADRLFEDPEREYTYVSNKDREISPASTEVDPGYPSTNNTSFRSEIALSSTDADSPEPDKRPLIDSCHGSHWLLSATDLVAHPRQCPSMDMANATVNSTRAFTQQPFAASRFDNHASQPYGMGEDMDITTASAMGPYNPGIVYPFASSGTRTPSFMASSAPANEVSYMVGGLDLVREGTPALVPPPHGLPFSTAAISDLGLETRYQWSAS